MSIDLHAHTYFSDGSLSPQALIDLAVEKKIDVLAITDHDEVGALHSAFEYATHVPIEIVSGVELSIAYNLPEQGHLHILGLFIDYQNEELNAILDQLKQARYDRIKTMLKKMNSLGCDLDIDELDQNIGYGSAGRPHLAQMLVEKGMVKDVPEAFSKFLSKGRPAYVPKKKLSAESAIHLIHCAGGLAIAAHPFSLGFSTYPEVGIEMLKLKALGLDGLEAYYTSHNAYITKWLLDFARENGLLISGGSDFHGDPRPEIQLGCGLGNLDIPYSVFENLKNYFEH
jgi:predicted metal-dependent phosphoesterase TrpH